MSAGSAGARGPTAHRWLFGEEKWFVHPGGFSRYIFPGQYPLFEGETPISPGAHLTLDVQKYGSTGLGGSQQPLTLAVEEAETDDPEVARAVHSIDNFTIVVVGLTPGETELEARTARRGWASVDIRVAPLDALVIEEPLDKNKDLCLRDGAVWLVGQSTTVSVSGYSPEDESVIVEGLDFLVEEQGKDLFEMEESTLYWHDPPDVETTYRATSPGTVRFRTPAPTSVNRLVSAFEEGGAVEGTMRVVILEEIDQLELLDVSRKYGPVRVELEASSGGDVICGDDWIDDQAPFEVTTTTPDACTPSTSGSPVLKLASPDSTAPCHFTIRLPRANNGEGLEVTGSYQP